MNRTSLLKLLIIFIFLFLFARHSQAKIPEPGNIIYGSLIGISDGTIVSLKINDITIASYTMNSKLSAGNNYVLNVPLDSVGERSPGTARPGDEAILYVGDNAVSTLIIGERGKINNFQVTDGDDDKDGVANSKDLCPNTPLGETVDANGCSESQKDDDKDGVVNAKDLCPDTPLGETVDVNGCSVNRKDDDEDGVVNSLDECPLTHPGDSVNGDGCSVDDLQDDDGDGIINGKDYCQGTLEGEEVDTDGCSDHDNNQPPVAKAGSNKSNVKENEEVQLNGSNSTDPDVGDELIYEWDQIAGPSVALSDSSASNPTFIAPNVGPEGVALIFRLTVRDIFDSDSDEVIVNVTWDNIPPVAVASDKNVNEREQVVLDGSGSYDPDEDQGDDIASYKWVQISGLKSVKLSDPNSAQPTFTAPEILSGEMALVFELTVTDNGGLKGTTRCIVNISNNGTPPIAYAGSDQNIYNTDIITKVTLDGSGSYDPDEGGSIVSYSWELIAGEVVLLPSSNVVQPEFSIPEILDKSISFEFKLTVTDDTGLKSSDDVIVNIVIDNNEPPVANAGSNQTVQGGTLVTLDATESKDPDGDIVSYLWTQKSGAQIIIENAGSSQATFTAPAILESNELLVFELTVIDNDGLKGSSTIFVNVIAEGVNITPPVAEAGENQTVEEGRFIELDGSSSSDSDGEIVSYLWRQTNGESVALSDVTSVRPTFITLATETPISLTFQLIVSDNDGLIDSDEVVITVENTDNNLPSSFNLLSPSNGDTGLGTAFSFIWEKSTDPDDPDGRDLSYDLYYCESKDVFSCGKPTKVLPLQKVIYHASVGSVIGLMVLSLLAFVNIRYKKGIFLSLLVVSLVFIISCSSGGGSSRSDNGGSTPEIQVNQKVSNLKPGTTYYWQVIATDANGGKTASEIWSFTTKE